MSPTNDHGQQVGAEVSGWEPRARPVPVVLEGAYVRVEPVSAKHVESLYDLLCQPPDEPLWTYRPAPMPVDRAGLGCEVAAWATAPEQLTFAIVPHAGELAGGDLAGGVAAGVATYTRIEPAHGQIEVASVLFARSLQRTRAATEALHLLSRHVFDDLGYRRLEWKCDALNEPSRRAAFRLGFRHEGCFRNHLVVRGRSRDTDWFSITDSEWPQVRARQERWLDPANFDREGRQRSALSDRMVGGGS